MDLSPRKKIILRAVVDDYINNAEPVGSKALVERGALPLSPATLRNEMSALTDMGYLEQPHTSAGRVPTARGYRKYVNELMRERNLTESERAAIDGSLHLRMRELDKLIAEAGRIVSSLTHYTAYSVMPQMEARKYLRFDLFCADQRSFVVVVVCEGGAVRNQMIHAGIPPVEEELRLLAAALNATLIGLSLSDITPGHEQEILRRAGKGGVFYPHVIAFLREDAVSGAKVYVSGESRLLEHPEYRDVTRARKLLEYMTDRDELSRLPAPEQDVRFLIGTENIAEELKDASVVVASYPVGDSLRGLIGLVGPTRMDYSALASRMSYFASRLGELFAGPPEQGAGETGGREIEPPAED